MSDLQQILREEYEKSIAEFMDPHALMSMIEEAMNKLGPLNEEETKGSSPSAARRDRTLRLPLQFPTEISIGQTPTSEDRQTFELWLSRIVPEGDLKAKIDSINSYVENPHSLSVADNLSYLMFLQTLAFILQEFNASVAGFLWEPFLAALFGDDSVQVPTSEGDIADAMISGVAVGHRQRVSLKILRERGATGGSFKDLVDHFRQHPQEPMIYVVIKKLANDQLHFFQFPISQETFFDFIGHPKIKRHTEVKQFTVPEEGLFMENGDPIVRREDLAALLNDSDFVPEGWSVSRKGKASNIRPPGSEKSISTTGVEPGQTYDIHLKSDEELATPAGPGVELTANAEKLWGKGEAYEKWYALYQNMQQVQPGGEGGLGPADFWDRVAKEAPGYRGAEQFHIAWNQLTKSEQVQDIGTLGIGKAELDKAFEQGAAAIGTDLSDLFTAMTDLVEDVSRFFLIDCGDPAGTAQKCSDKDVALRSQSGHEAVEEAGVIQRVVNDKIASQIE